jgi:hypothetical protein
MNRLKQIKADILRRPFFYVPLIAGALFMLALIIRYGVNTPFYDQWEMVPLFQKFNNHTLGLADFWRQHNEHRILFPLLTSFAIDHFTHWQTGAEVLAGYVCSVITASLLFVFLRRSVSSAVAVAGSLIAAWFFSPIQWENWLWGWQIEWFMSVLFVVATIFLLMRFISSKSIDHRKILFTLAVATAFIATFSLASGIFVWLLGVFILIASRQGRRPIVTWVVAGLASTTLYYYHYAQTVTPSGPARTVLFHHIFLFVEFFVAFIGGVAGASNGNIQTPDVVGMLLLLALVPLLWVLWTQRHKNLVINLPWLSLILYGLLCGLSTAFGRLGYGIGFALSSRYSTLSVLYTIGITGLAFSLLSSHRGIGRQLRAGFIACLVLISLPLLTSSYVVGFQGFQSQSVLLKNIKTCTHETNPTDACLLQTYPNPQVVRPRLEYVKTNHLAGY